MGKWLNRALDTLDPLDSNALELSLDEEASIWTWLAHIKETDPITIAEVLNKCRVEVDARRCFLQLSEDAPGLIATNKSITCHDCIHFERTDHSRLGHCAKGEPEAIAGLWDSSPRHCEKYLPIVKTTGDRHARD